MRYAAALSKALDEAPAAPAGLTRAEIEAAIAALDADLKRPCGDALRITLCAERASLRRALAATG